MPSLTSLTESVSSPRAAAPLCAHCALPVPAGLLDPETSEQFCCRGCRAVRSAIESCGLGNYYRLKSADETAAPASPSGRAYADLDEPSFLDRHAPKLAEGLRWTELYLEGVHCSACVWLLEKLPRAVAGVIEARLDMRRAILRVTWNEREVSLSAIARTLDSFGYLPHAGRDVEARAARQREDRRFLIRIGVAGAGAGNVMLLAFALYGGFLHGMEVEYARLFRWTSMVIGLVVLLWPGALFFRGAWAALRTRSAHLDLPIAIGLAAGAIAGTVNTVLGRGEIYFDSLTGLVFLLLVGRFVQHRLERRAADTVETLFTLSPSFARIRSGDTVREVPVEALAPGQIAEVHPGESFPADGAVCEGDSMVNLSLLTGESRPVPVHPGDIVFSGAVNMSRVLLLRITATGRVTRVGKLLALIEECSRRKAPIVLLADRIAGWFSVTAIGLAVVTLVTWLFIDPHRAVDHAVSLLIVSCPCGLGLATPFAVSVALGRAARARILVKGGDILEKIAGKRSTAGVLFLDKTGTLTEDHLSVVEWQESPTLAMPMLRAWVAALESQSAHPIAQAFALEASSADHAVILTAAHDSGIEGTVDGHALLVGADRFVRRHLGEVPAWAEAARRDFTARQLTPVFVTLDRRLAAVAGVGSGIRPDAKDTIRAFQHRGLRVEILSGDEPGTVLTVGRSLGLAPEHCHGGLCPEDKVSFVERAKREAPVFMVGDGVNDAAALSAATVGIAVHGGAEASLAAADVYLGRPGVAALVELFSGATRTLSVIRRCLVVSLGYNAIAAALAFTGVVNALQAAILMPVASFTVLGMALWTRTFAAPDKASPCR
ncbi:MAG TPA: heavy metal translocating P-type ATPase [Polyangia bacterium]